MTDACPAGPDEEHGGGYPGRREDGGVVTGPGGRRDRLGVRFPNRLGERPADRRAHRHRRLLPGQGGFPRAAALAGCFVRYLPEPGHQAVEGLVGPGPRVHAHGYLIRDHVGRRAVHGQLSGGGPPPGIGPGE